MKQEIRDILYLLQHNEHIMTEDKRKLRRYIEDLENRNENAIEYIEEKGRLKYSPNDLINILRGNNEQRKHKR